MTFLWSAKRHTMTIHTCLYLLPAKKPELSDGGKYTGKAGLLKAAPQPLLASGFMSPLPA
jgi:hypothetical protein